MKVIFLDFDGVLNCHSYLLSLDKSDPDYDPDHRLCADRVELVNRICEATGAKVVVSSQWRAIRSVDELQALLEKRGFQGGVIGKTLPGGTDHRGEQISEYLRNRGAGVEQYVVLDDIGGACVEPVGHRLIQTEYMGEGLTEEHVKMAIEMMEVVG